MSISVVIPVRNRPELLADAIKSVQLQTRPVDEIIIVDDGSTDETVAVAKAMASRDPKIRIIEHGQSCGAARARNTGIEAASCEWIAFLDSDDEWMPEKIEKQEQALKAVPGAIGSFTSIRYSSSQTCLPATISLHDLLRWNVLGSTSTALVARSALQEVGNFDPTLPSCQDWDLWIKLRRIGDFALVSEPLIRYRESNSDRISVNEASVLKGHSVLYQRATNGVSGVAARGIKSAHKQRMSNIYLWEWGKPGSGLKFAVQAFLLRPNRTSLSAIGSCFKRMMRSSS